MRAWASEGKDILLSGYLRTLNQNDLTDVASSVLVELRVRDISKTTTTLLPATSVATTGDVSWSFFEAAIPLPSSVADATEGKSLMLCFLSLHEIFLASIAHGMLSIIYLSYSDD